MEVRPGYKQTEAGVIPEEWNCKPFGTVLRKLNAKEFQITTAGYQSSGMIPVVDQGKDEVVGFSDRQDKRFLCPAGGVIVFGDHTRIVKYICFDFVVGADGTQILAAREDQDTRFHAYQLRRREIPNTGYNRHFKFIKEMWLATPPLSGQRAIAGTLGDVDALIDALTRLIAKKRDLKQATMQQLLTGQTRLPGFSGEWKMLRMAEKSILKARIGWQGLTTSEYLPIGEYFLVTGTDFVNGRVNWASCCFVDTDRYVQDKNIQLRTRDILLTKDGTIGKVGFVDFLPGPATLNSGVFVIRPKGNDYDPLFFYYILTSRVFEEFLAQLQAGSTISHLYQKDFVNFSFRAPRLPEQTAIVEVLSDMDVEMAALERRLAKTRALKQGMMQELLTGRIRLV
jgi:type I restriction enzyme S subunit